ncbi:CatB-related O-acetyltransferase [uncultured Anaerovibrio sp.]|uniref:CatB-related O-acetyltransferase n=1 Tax=uncultured Anaerovibrio sp. TaxID=361586 RepID=UPI00262DEA93|nr:CatB-related O-acetyltransferase [uncultured Anaerovibrio sp.]
MIYDFSVSHGAGTRKISYGDDSEHLAVTVGDGSYITDASIEFGNTKCHVLVGRYCSIAHRVVFEVGLNHDYHCVTTYPFDDFEIMDPLNANHAYRANKNQIIIGNDVWIGCDVIIMGGVKIGNGAVIGAGAVVAKDVPPYSIVVGNPARVIKYRFEPDVIQRLQEIKWWYWPEEEIKAKYPLMKDMDRFLAACQDIHFGDNEDDTVRSLKLLKSDSYYIYYMVADFSMTDSVWRHVLEEYLNTFSEDNKVLLVVEIPENSERYVAEMTKIIAKAGENAPIVVTHETTNGICPALYRLVDTYIATKNEFTSVVVDFMSGMDVKIVYGMDFGIF